MIPLFKVFISDKASDSVSKVLDSGYIGQGPVVDKFEEHLKEWFRLDYLLTTNSATSAEHLALHLLKRKTDNQKVFDVFIDAMSHMNDVARENSIPEKKIKLPKLKKMG